MKVHELRREQWMPAPLGAVFGFFSDARNLQRITPPWLGFRILTAEPIEIAAGTRIDYALRLAGIPLRWRTRIADWKPGDRFTDVQERGPYQLWEHEHRFRPLGGGVLMTDVVRYALPWGPVGGVAHALGVRAALAAIFDYRAREIRRIFSEGDEAHLDGIHASRPHEADSQPE